MNFPGAQRMQSHRFFYAVALVVMAMAALLVAGCAARPGTAVAPGAGNDRDIATASDETDASKRARIRLELAYGYFEQGQTTVALDEVKQVLALDPQSTPGYILRGLIYVRLNDPGLAEESYRRALQISPKNPDALHNYAWMLCQQNRFNESFANFSQALSVPGYGGQARTMMTQGICQVRAGLKADAERSLTRSYELDAGNPVTAYNLTQLLYERGDFSHAQFYIRRLNNSDLANAESLWLGVKVERALKNAQAERQLGDQLRRRYAQSKEARALERGAYDE